MRNAALVLAAALALASAAPAAAPPAAPRFQGTTCPSNEQLRHYETVSSPRLSPDGRWVAYVQREGTAEGARSHIWLAATAPPAQARQVTQSPAAEKAGESDPQWMPDTSALLFLAKRGEHRQIFRLRMAMPSGDAEPLAITVPVAGAQAPVALDINSFFISPDGRWIALVARPPQTPAAEKKIKDKDDPDVVGQDRRPARLWLYSFQDGQVKAVTAADRQARFAAWAPDSRRLAVITAPPGDADDLGPQNRLAIVTVPDLRVTPLPQALASAETAASSPDGATLALVAQSERDVPPGVGALWVMPASGGAPRDLTDSGEFNLAGREAIWANDGSAIYIGAQRGTTAGLARVAVTHGAIRYWPQSAPVETNFATNPRQTGWTYVAQASDRLPQVVYAASPGAAAAVLSAANADWPAGGWVAAATIQWRGPGDLPIEGLLYWPEAEHCGAATPVGGKLPLIVEVHGGPTGAFLQSFSPFNQWLLAQGWALLEPNPRGSTGYGAAFVAANKNDLGDRDFDDVMAGVDWALAHEPVDARRLGLLGYSYGGEMAGFVEGKTDRFAAVISGAPVIDQYSEYGTEDGSWYDRWFFGQPWLRPQDAWRQSPLAYAAHAKSPLLLLQGQADTTDPLGQSQEMYRALHQMGVPVELVTYPRENHGTLAGGILGAPSREPWHGFDARQRIAAWFREHFKARGQESGAKELQR